MKTSEGKQKRTWLGLNAYEEITMWKPEPLNIKAGAGEDWFIKEWKKEMKGDWPNRQDTPLPNQLFLIDWETKGIEELAGY